MEQRVINSLRHVKLAHKIHDRSRRRLRAAQKAFEETKEAVRQAEDGFCETIRQHVLNAVQLYNEAPDTKWRIPSGSFDVRLNFEDAVLYMCANKLIGKDGKEPVIEDSGEHAYCPEDTKNMTDEIGRTLDPILKKEGIPFSLGEAHASQYYFHPPWE